MNVTSQETGEDCGEDSLVLKLLKDFSHLLDLNQETSDTVL